MWGGIRRQRTPFPPRADQADDIDERRICTKHKRELATLSYDRIMKCVYWNLFNIILFQFSLSVYISSLIVSVNVSLSSSARIFGPVCCCLEIPPISPSRPSFCFYLSLSSNIVSMCSRRSSVSHHFTLCVFLSIFLRLFKLVFCLRICVCILLRKQAFVSGWREGERDKDWEKEIHESVSKA